MFITGLVVFLLLTIFLIVFSRVKNMLSNSSGKLDILES